MFKFKLVLIAFTLVLSKLNSQNVIRANQYASGLVLGKSFDLFDPSVAYASNVFDSKTIVNNGQTSSEVYFYLLQNNSGLSVSSNVDMGMKASFLGFGGANGSYNTQEQQLFNQNNLTICLMGVSDYGNFEISNPVLNANFISAINDTLTFKQKYGEFYVSGVNKKQIIYLYLTISNISGSQRNEIIASIGGSVGIGIFSASAQASVNKAMESWIKSKTITISVKTFGKNSLSGLPINQICSDFFSNNDLSGNSYQALVKYMSNNFKEDNGSVTEYYYSPLSQFGYRNDGYFNTITRKQQKYLSLVKKFIELSSMEVGMNNVPNLPGYFLRTNSEESYINTVKSNLGIDIDNLSDAISDCRNSECKPMTSCCNQPTLTTIDMAKLFQLRGFFSCPFNALNKTYYTPTSLSINTGSCSIISNNDRKFMNSGINNITNNGSTYKISSNIYLKNEHPFGAWYTFQILVNGQMIEMSQGIYAKANEIINYNWLSKDYNLTDKFNNGFPNKIEVKTFISGFMPGDILSKITIMPPSNVTFNYVCSEFY